MRQRNVAANESPMPDIERSAAIIGQRIVLVRKKTSRTGGAASEKPSAAPARTGIAVGITQRVEAKQRQLFPRRDSYVRDELVLAEDSFGVVLIDIATSILRLQGIPTIQRRIDVADVKGVLATRIQIRQRQGRSLCDLALNAGRALDRVGRAEIRRNLVHRGRGSRRKVAERR